MSIKYRQLSRFKEARQYIVVRLSDGVSVEGNIIDLDQNDVCIFSEGFERILSLAAIIDIQVKSPGNLLYKQLHGFMQSKILVDLYLQNGESISSATILDLEDTSMVLKNQDQERLITVDQIDRITPSVNNLQQVTLSIIPTNSTVMYPTIQSSSALLEQELASISWGVNQFPEIIKACPVPFRTNPKVAKIWDRALNFVNDRSWRKAAEEFAEFALQKPDSFESYHNAGVCWLKLSDYGMASIYCDYGISYNSNIQTLISGIVAANHAQYWHKSLERMLKYLMVTKGVDTRAYIAIDFGVKFGMYRLTLQHIGWGIEANIPMDWKWLIVRLAYIAIRYPNLSNTILFEIEQMLVSQQVNGKDVMRIIETLFAVVSDMPTLEYRTSQELELTFSESNPSSLTLSRSTQLRSEIDKLYKSYKYHEAKERVQELLSILPHDIEAKKILKDLEIRLAPSPVYGSHKTTSSNPKTAYSSSTYNSAKKAEQRGDLEKAISLYRECIDKQESKWQSAVMDLAGICLRREDIEVGVKYILKYQKSLDLIASNNMLGALYFKGGKYDDAVSAYRVVVSNKMTGRERVPPLISIAMIQIRQDKIDEAEGIIKKVLKIQPSQPAAKGLMESIRTGSIQSQIRNVEIDKEGYLNLSRVVGVGTIGIGDFLQAELESAEITGLERKMIVNSSFGLKEINYLLGRARDLGIGKPEQQAQYYISAARVLDILNERGDERFPESLRRFCGAQADYYAIKNFDVARTYYVESFRLENTVSPQLKIYFVRILMTFLCEPEEFLKAEPSYDVATLLENGLNHQDSLVRRGITLSVLNVARRNPDILIKSQEDFQKSKIRNAMVRSLAEILDEEITNSDFQALKRLIVAGQQYIESAEHMLEERFKWFFENSNTAQLIYDFYDRFVAWKPNFTNASVDFGGRDANRIEEMKNVLRQYSRFMLEDVYEEKDNLRNLVITQIDRLKRDIEQFPTYYSRCHMLPMLHRWEQIVTTYFDEISSVSRPNLEVIAVVKATYDNNVVSAHLIISNEQGKSAASGIKLQILSSQSMEYELVEPILEFGKTLRAGEQATIVCQVKLHEIIPAFTLNYCLVYTDRQGAIIHTEEHGIPVRLSQDKFSPINNPYTRWASSNEVTDAQMFFGRDQLVEELINLFSVPGQRKMIVIHGQKRAGKSSILYHVKDRIDKQGSLDDVIVCAFKMSIGDVITNFTLANFFYVLARELHKNAQEKLKTYGLQFEFVRPGRDIFREDPFNQFLEYTQELIDQIQQLTDLAVNLLMIIDEFTYVYELIQRGSLDTHFMKAWKALVERRIFSFLLSGIDEMPEFVNAYPNEFAIADLRRVSYLDIDSSRGLIEEPVWDVQNKVTRFQERAIQRIQELTGGSAYYIQIYGNQLVDYMNEEMTGYITEADIDAVMRRLTYGRHALNLASNFDNLTRYKNSEQDTPEVIIEGKVLRLIAFLTKNENFAHRDSIFRRFSETETTNVERIISRLIDREVLKARAGSQQYAFVVELFKEWLNMNLPYEEGMIHDRT